eukprot:g15266.t1
MRIGRIVAPRVELVEGHQKAQQLAEENKELFKTVQQLRRQLQRLEGLKKRVMESISDEQYVENSEDSKLYMRDDYLAGALPMTVQSMQGDIGFARPSGLPATPESYRPNWDAGAPVQSEDHEGCKFFRQARNSLSYEAFNEFLANIKRLNNQQQSRETTLEEAKRIFGPDLQHLYQDFELLLNRHGA